MINSIYRYFDHACDYVYYMCWGYHLSATPENLDWAVKQEKCERLKYEFTDANRTYSILEFAVKCQNQAIVASLIELAASAPTLLANKDSIFRVYMENLAENTPPNLEFLNFLIENMFANEKEKSECLGRSLTCALEKMALFKKIHWSVVKALFEQGAAIPDHSCRTPFTILRDCYAHRIDDYGYLALSEDEEIHYLHHLKKYARLEKRFHTHSMCCLSLEEFQSHSRRLHANLTRAALDMRNPQLKKAISISRLGQDLILYHTYFESLVQKDTRFKECFEPWELETIGATLEKSTEVSAHSVHRLMKLWGLLEENES